MEENKTKHFFKKHSALFSALPVVLQEKCIKSTAVAYAVSAIAAICSIVIQNPVCLIWLLPAAYIFYKGYSIPWHWHSQRIICGRCKCIRVTKPIWARKFLCLYLKEIGEGMSESTDTIECYVGATRKTKAALIDGITIDAYFDLENPKYLFAWKIVG